VQQLEVHVMQQLELFPAQSARDTVMQQNFRLLYGDSRDAQPRDPDAGHDDGDDCDD
jgi:hypothetical protein